MPDSAAYEVQSRHLATQTIKVFLCHLSPVGTTKLQRFSWNFISGRTENSQDGVKIVYKSFHSSTAVCVTVQLTQFTPAVELHFHI